MGCVFKRVSGVSVLGLKRPTKACVDVAEVLHVRLCVSKHEPHMRVQCCPLLFYYFLPGFDVVGE